MNQGISRSDTVSSAHLERGSFEPAKEVVRSGGWESVLERCWQDLRYALGIFRKNPGFTAIALLTLTLEAPRVLSRSAWFVSVSQGWSKLHLCVPPHE